MTDRRTPEQAAAWDRLNRAADAWGRAHDAYQRARTLADSDRAAAAEQEAHRELCAAREAVYPGMRNPDPAAPASS